MRSALLSTDDTALFTVIVRYIFTSCRKYPANKVGLTKKASAECLQFVI